MTSYIQRLDRLEKLAMTIEGVQQAFAIQAGREIRVVVSPQDVSDDRAREIAKELRAALRRSSSIRARSRSPSSGRAVLPRPRPSFSHGQPEDPGAFPQSRARG